jgi:exodeoxyribonuclease VII small subunit
MKKEKETDLSFEEALSRLETIVSQLEQENVPLEESVKQFEEGVKLSKHCSRILEEAELRVEQVNKNNKTAE